MPQSQGKKRSSNKESLPVLKCDDSNYSSVAGTNSVLNTSGGSYSSVKCRKRKHCDLVRFSDLESEFEDCDLEDAAALETKLRKVARRNSLTHDEMMKLLHKFVKNEHILALVTLKAEDELAKEKQTNEEQRALIITETPSVPKLTRAKARELIEKSNIKVPSLKDIETEPEIAALIKEDLHSDEEDEEYVFKEEDYASDDDPYATASDMESNPRTPITPANMIEASPVKLTDDGCFKVPLNVKSTELSEELIIAARTRSKLCLEQTTIEDLQSEFVPPDVDAFETSDFQTIDEVWMQFLNDFTKPLTATLIADDDDPINDPEYVAAEKVPVDAEELRDVNISKKELSELLGELYDGLMAEDLCMQSIELETSSKVLEIHQEDRLNTPNASPRRSDSNLDVSHKFDFGEKPNSQQFPDGQNERSGMSRTNPVNIQQVSETPTESNTFPTSSNNRQEYTFEPSVMSTPSACKNKTNYDTEDNNLNSSSLTLIPIAQTDNSENTNNKTVIIDASTLNTQLGLIAVPIPEQPNCFKLVKVLDNSENEFISSPCLLTNENSDIVTTSLSSKNSSKPYEINYTCNYISVRRHIIAEYIEKFKALQHAQDNKISSTTTEITEVASQSVYTGFTQYQYDLMQQQLRIHIQQMTQTFVQTYCHPELWKLAPKSKELLMDLQEKAKTNVNFQVWNLEPAIHLIHNWETELDQDTPENTELMNFLHHENIVTNHQSRQIPRFHPRILECYLNSPVFMYPQYLPRMPFSAKPSIPIFSPVEAYLIAMGLEKHLHDIYEKKEKISYKTTPLRVACKRLAKDTVCGKRYRRIWDHILHLQKVDYYNPIKYFFEHNRAPPVDHDPIWTFNNNVVLPPKERISELPLVFQTYLQKKNDPPKTKRDKNKKSRIRSSSAKIKDDIFKNSYVEFVQEAVGRDLPIHNLFYDPVESSDTLISDTDSYNEIAEKQKKLFNYKVKSKRKLPESLTVNINYVYGNGLNAGTTSHSSPLSAIPSYTIEYSPSSLLQTSQLCKGDKEKTTPKSNNNCPHTGADIVDNETTASSLPDSTINSTNDLPNSNLNDTDCPVITYNFDWKTKTLQPATDISHLNINLPSNQSANIAENQPLIISNYINRKKKLRPFKRNISRSLTNQKRIKQRALAYREKRRLKLRCEELITTYSLYLNKIILEHKRNPLIQHYYRNFKALELYTYLLKGLKSICCNSSKTMSNTSYSSPSNLKRTRTSNSNTEDDNNSPSSGRQVRKLNRQEENCRLMLLPDTPEEANRKDGIYAFNFYEKVEEAFKTANKPEDCKRFNAILKSFDPKKDKVSDLYYKLEKLFLPDHPELAQVFLTFLLPSEAAAIGKFFEHFMINNMSTFINKLNIYFNKQPAQIRKIYNCLHDLAEDPLVTMKSVESKIVPLLKGNQFLIDWFMQQFPKNAPPERLYSQAEYINLKDQQSHRSGEYMETVTDLMDSPTNDVQQQPSCQLKYINGRIFYGSKMLLPAKLSFMAASYRDKIQTNETSAPTTFSGCLHDIKEHGEKRLLAAAVQTSTHISTAEPSSADDQEKSEEEDTSKGLVIDTTADEEDSCSSVELCDEVTLKAHANRLNPSVYGSACFTAGHASGTTNLAYNSLAHHAHSKKTHLNFHDEPKLSPRKNLSSSTTTQLNLNSHLATTIPNSPIGSKDKRKSPSKKTKSPLSNSCKASKTNNAVAQPMVVIHETNSAIQCAKRLKSLIEEEYQQSDSAEEVIDSKDIIQIVARTKKSLQSSQTMTADQICEAVKEEKSEDLSFLAEHSTLSASPFPCLRIETDSNEEDAYNAKTSISPSLTTQPTAPANDEDCKIDIVTSLTTEPDNTSSEDNRTPTTLPLNAWTRDEDKIILIEMKIGSQNRIELYERIAEKLPSRTMLEITSRHQFLMDFLSKLQGK